MNTFDPLPRSAHRRAAHRRAARRRTGAALALTIAAVGLVAQVRAGCLAPADSVIDGAGAVGPFWGGDGELLYTRDLTGTTPELVRRQLGGGPDVLAEAGERNDFLIGSERETWTDFHAGTLSSVGDVAFVASTSLPDDPLTGENESIARRGVYVQRGNSMYEVARYGTDSPIAADGGGFAPWGSFFDAAAGRRTDQGRARAVFLGQLGVPDGRTGVFRWDENTFGIAPLVVTGDDAPGGGVFTSIARTRANEQGDVAFSALARQDDGELVPALFLVRDDTTQDLLVRFGLAGDPSPIGGKFAILSDFSLADDGTIVFAGTVVNGSAPTGLFRARPPLYEPEAVVLEGDETPLGGTFANFEAAKVRMTPIGELVFGVRLSDDVGGEGVFAVDGQGRVLPLSNPDSTLAVAALGNGSAAYQTTENTATVTPSDGSEEGPDDFVVTKIDLKNKVPLRKDSLRFEGAFRLRPQGDGIGEAAPVVIGPGDFERRTTDRIWTGNELTRVAEVRIVLSQSPGNAFVFGVDAGGGGTLTYNGVSQSAPKVKFAKDGSSARWSWKSDIGRGKLTVDVGDGTFALKLGGGTLQGSYESTAYRTTFTLRSAADVAANRQDAAALFHRSFLMGAERPAFGSGSRVVSDGRGTPGGGLFVNSLSVKRKLRTVKGQAAPVVASDKISVDGVLRICPGSSAPATPGLVATLRVGDVFLPDVQLTRRGKSGSRYRYKSARGLTPKVRFDLDVVSGTYKLSAKGVDPLSGLVDADFSGGAGANAASADVGGMSLPFELSIDRVYEDSFDVPMVRRKGGKVFTR